MRPPRKSSRRRQRPTRSCPTSTSGQPTTASVTPPWTAAAGGSAAAASVAAAAATSSAMCLATSSAAVVAAAGGWPGARVRATSWRLRWAGACGARAPPCARPRRWPVRGSDVRYDLAIELEEAVRGTTATIRGPSAVACEGCEGSGARKGSSPVNCTTCGGLGQVRMQQGFFAVQQTCPNCRGRGKIITDPCEDCRGLGVTEKTRTLSVKVPPGVDTGDRIRLSGEGEAGPNGGPAGDLYVQIAVREHPIFERDGRHLYCEVPISFADAALGGELEVPTLDGRVRLKIPAETQTGRVFRIRGKGVAPVRGGGTGDLLCRVVLETPINLNKTQKELLREFQQSMDADGRRQSPRISSWFEGVKRFFDEMKI